jgi:hypothetical protein
MSLLVLGGGPPIARGIGSAASAPSWQSAAESVPPFQSADPEDLAPATTPTQAIGAWWDLRSDLAGLFSGGQLFAGEAPSTVLGMPYAVLIEVSSGAETYTTGPAVIRSTYQINCMADDLAEAESLALAVRDAFNHAPLTIGDNEVGHCLVGGTHWTLGVGLGIGGSDCWVCYVELEILWSR